ncbi:hypothetical protein SUGI_1159520 [Cryptomeria japonica]|nr:hypothetical protein SUGI_1159520 [Cryptomeria japonica]
MISRFPNLTDVDLTIACIPAPKNSAVWLTNQFLKIQLTPEVYDPQSIERFILEQQILPASLDKGLKILAQGCQGLQRLCVVDSRKPVYGHVRASHKPDMNGNTKEFDKEAFGLGLKQSAEENGIRILNTSDTGFAWIAKNCQMLQELELHQCTDESITAISSFKNLQILRLVGSIAEFYHFSFTDIGLTILGHNCKRLVKLELSGCEASYDGVAAIGQCCLMLEELTLIDQKFYEGWIAALSFCRNLKTLRLESCRGIDPNPGPIEHLGFCPALQRLQLVRCKLREDKVGFCALVLICATVRELEFQDCWGLDDEVFKLAINCRRVRSLSLEGCSLLSTSVLETVLLGLKDLQRLRVVSCNNIKDIEISSSLASLFTTLKQLKWRPDTKSLLASYLVGTEMGRKGGRFFKRP